MRSEIMLFMLFTFRWFTDFDFYQAEGWV